MKLKEIYIYGYGKLNDFHFPSGTSLQVIYGENEAGKSTLMSFIHSILFGFPTKQQSELRYEPKNSGKYGGKLVLDTKHGEITIERIRGRAAGDVTVTFANGTVGSDELLNELLNGMDRRMYQSIFSFNIHGIQDVGRMKGEDISKYLLAAGTFGTDTLMNVEQHLQKEQDALFKPNGQVPNNPFPFLVNSRLKTEHRVDGMYFPPHNAHEEYQYENPLQVFCYTGPFCSLLHVFPDN